MNDKGRFAECDQILCSVFSSPFRWRSCSAKGTRWESDGIRDGFADMHMVVEGVMQDYVFGNMLPGCAVSEPVIFYCIPGVNMTSCLAQG